MNNFKFTTYQFFLFTIALLTNVLFDKHIGPPPDITDLISLVISLPIYIFVVLSIRHLYKRHRTISRRNKIALSIFAFFSSIVFLAILESIWFEITGKMLF
ncbi:hypothetical protein [Halalkalibacter akibai]|uniref:hypothetical protein n=1 Tax=Halalkalibacter akibai TaxID=1411 RepID=UPI0005566650|nr:hypothetical protein [Halalkalibacter akibai]